MATKEFSYTKEATLQIEAKAEEPKKMTKIILQKTQTQTNLLHKMKVKIKQIAIHKIQ